MPTAILPELTKALFEGRYNRLDGRIRSTRLVNVQIICIGEDDYRVIATVIKDHEPATVSIALVDTDGAIERNCLIEYIAQAVRGLEATARLLASPPIGVGDDVFDGLPRALFQAPSSIQLVEDEVYGFTGGFLDG